MGLIVSVYRDGDRDCTNDGISSKANRLCLVNVRGPSEPSDDAPAAMLLPHMVCGPNYPMVRIVPAVSVDGSWAKIPRHVMFGGNYAGTSDMRLREAIEQILPSWHGAVCIHDRIEG